MLFLFTKGPDSTYISLIGPIASVVIVLSFGNIKAATGDI